MTQAFGVAVQDGDVVVFQLQGNGGPDPKFNGGGQLISSNEGHDFGFGIAVQPDPGGKVVVAGRRGGFNIVDSVGTIDRFNPDGSFDTGGAGFGPSRPVGRP